MYNVYNKIHIYFTHSVHTRLFMFYTEDVLLFFLFVSIIVGLYVF